ncbi:MAG: lamin tail domain-containing protein, partial [Verrucomicrobiales bacterium]|nr:lamin tail domain-containing protein [Verrucomicrobiales bacterium]
MKMRLPVWAGLVLLSAAPNLIRAEQVYLSEIHYNPKGSAPEYLELTNTSATVLDLAEWKFTDGIDYVFPEYSDADAEASFLKAWERIVISPLDEASFRASYPGVPADVRVFGPWSGNLSNAGERIMLRDKNGIPLTTVDYRDGGRKWPVAADGVGHSLRITSLLGKADDWRNWQTSLGIGGTPGTEPQAGSGRPTGSPEIDLGEMFPVVGYGASWKYHDLTAEPPADWAGSDFNDGAWPEHPGMFGFDGSRALPEPGLWEAPAGQVNWRRDSLGGLVTWYARKEFIYNGETSGANLGVDGFLDDGAVFYLNGQEIERVRIAAGVVDWQTVASRATENTVAEELVARNVSGILVEGVNVLAVEVHN